MLITLLYNKYYKSAKNKNWFSSLGRSLARVQSVPKEV